MDRHRVPVPHWVQLVVLPLAIVGLFLLLRAAGPVVLLFTIAGIFALLLNPFVSVLRRSRVPRGPAVAIVMLLVVTVIAGIGFLIADPIADQVSALQRNVPGYVDDANEGLADLQAWLDRNGVDIQVTEQGQTALETI